jgi:alkaline phosphatase
MRRPRPGLLALWLLLAVAAAGCASLTPAAPPGPKNIVVFIADGVGAPQIELAHQASLHLRKEPLAIVDGVFRRGSVGLMTTHARETLTTDSAAGATAMSTGVKTHNGMVAMTPEGDRLATALQSAQLRGKRIGLVTTAAVTDATPAAFSVHARSRRDAGTIVDGYLRLAPDVILGGGAAQFLPESTGGRRRDGRDAIAEFSGKGYAIARTRADLAGVRDGRLLGLFAGEDLGHEIDRHATGAPSLAELTETALRLLARDDGRGFVLLVESEATDSAGHANDLAALIHDLWAFDRAVQVGLAFQARAPGDTLIVVAGDHETGGLSPTLTGAPDGKGVVISAPEHLTMVAGITMSLDRAARTLGPTPTDAAIDALVSRHFPGFTPDDEVRDALRRRRRLDPVFPWTTQHALSRMIARRTGFYWATGAHAADPVAVGALGPGAERFRGYIDNTDFGRALQVLIRAGD